MNNQTMIILIVLTFFMLNSQINSKKSLENFALTSNCDACLKEVPTEAVCKNFVNEFYNKNHSSVFDAECYLREFPDVAKAGTDALEHYNKYGKIL